MPDKDDKESSLDRIKRMTDWPAIISGDGADIFRPPKKKAVDQSEDPGTTPETASSKGEQPE